MWWRKKTGKKRDAGSGSPAEIYLDLRSRVLELDPATVGIEPSDAHPRVWGALLETGFAEGSATVVGLADGTTSLYTSTGGGVIGGGEHESVARETHAFLATLEQHMQELDVDAGAPPAPPADGLVNVCALTYSGLLAKTVPEDDLGYDRHPLSPVFHAGHRVITALRLIDERGA